MMYKFKSKAAGDVIMLGPNGDQLLGLIGKTPGAKGIIETAAMPAAIAALEAAVAQDEAAGKPSAVGQVEDGDEPGGNKGISLRQRVWPMVDMMKRAHAEGHEIVWGV